MTNKEAAGILCMVQAHGSLVIKAKEKAIEALKHEDMAEKYANLKDAISDIKAEIREQKSNYTDKEVLEIIDRYLDVIGEKEGEAE